jgi:type IV secretory pathway VirB2 component (pilin)/type IV secretory pathway VirB6-like protein
MRQAKRQAGSTLVLALGLIAIAVLAPLAAHASAPPVPTAIQGLLCEMVGIATGTTGKAMASVAIIAMGIAALFGKISWNMAAIVLVGIALIFGSSGMIGSLGGFNTCSSSTGGFSFSCAGGAPTGNSNMFQADVMTNYSAATGDYNDANGAENGFNTNCASGGTNPGIFATILCFFKAVVGQILSSMYCQFQSVMVGPITTAMTLFTMLFGFMIMTGITNFTAKEATLFLLKMAIIWTFALNPAWGIGVGYQFFMGIAEEGSALVTQGSTAQLTDPDSMIGSLLSFISGNPSSQWAGNLTNSTYSGMSQWCVLYATLAVAALLFFMPMVSMFLIMLLLQYLGLYFRAVLGYLTALVLISFLFVLSPIFIGFALFKTTLPLFEQWVKFLISFSVQMIIVFGFLTMIQYVPVGSYFTELLGLLKQYDVTGGKANNAQSSHVCSICEYTINTTVVPETIACNTNGTQVYTTDVNATSPDTGYVIPLTALSQHMDFFRFTISKTLAFYLIFWVIQDFLKRVPDFARSIGGLQVTPPLAGEDFLGQGIGDLQDAWTNFVGSHQGMAKGLLAGGALTAGAMALLRNGYGGASSGSVSSCSGATLPRAALGTGAATASSARLSGPAGTGKMNIEAAVSQIDNTPGTYGYCAHAVRLALEAGGVNTTGHGEYASQYDPLLLREGFKVVSGSNYVPKKGDVVVIHATDGGGAGHIAMYDGHQWVSDHKQRTMLDGLHVTSYAIYRANETGSNTTATAAASTKGQTLAQAYAANGQPAGTPGGSGTGTTTSSKSSGSGSSGPSASGETTSAPGQGINSSNKAEKMAAETKHLMNKFGLTEQQAAAITGNLVGESNMVGNQQELRPLSGRGGLGWAQWTGPRRLQFEAFMRANPHLTPDEASQQFLDHELSTTYKGTIAELKQTNNLHEATHVFLATFERPAHDNTATREVYAEQALAAVEGKPIAAETAIASVNFPQGTGGGGGGAGWGGGGGLISLASVSASDAGDGEGQDMIMPVSDTQIVDPNGFRVNPVNAWQSSQSSVSSMNAEADDAKQKADAKAAADKKAADDAAAAAAAASSTSSAPVTQQVAQLQQDTYNALKSLELELSVSRNSMPQAMITQTENTIGAALIALTTDNTEEGLARALEQVRMAQRFLK